MKILYKFIAIVIMCGAVVLCSTPVASAQTVKQVGNTSGIAVLDSSGTLWYYYQTLYTTQWNKKQIAPPGFTYSSPSLVTVGGNTVAIAEKGPSGNLWFHWQWVGQEQVPWYPELVAGVGATDGEPSLAQIGNTLAIATRHSDGTLWYYYQTIGSSAPWTAVPVKNAYGQNAIISSDPSLAQIGNSAAIVAEDPWGNLVYWTASLSWPWQEQAIDSGVGFPYLKPSLARIGNSAAVAVRYPNGSLRYYWKTIGDIYWYHWIVAGPGPNSANPGLLASSAPSLAQVGNTAGIVVEGSGSKLWYYWQTIGSPRPWKVYQVSGQSFTSLEPSLAQVGGSPTIVADGPDGPGNSLCYYWQWFGQEQLPWHPEQVRQGNMCTT